MTVDDGALD